MIVKTNEFVAALKSLRMHQKRRRRLNILIRQGNDAGEVIFELSGDSPNSGVLTTLIDSSGQSSSTIFKKKVCNTSASSLTAIFNAFPVLAR